MTSILPELKTLLAYKNEAVVQRYTKEFPHASLSAEVAFEELMKFMWLSLKAQADRKNFTCAMHEEMFDIDNMWHCFVLFTRDYQYFCETYLGKFFHHNPLTEDEKELSDEEYENELTEYLNYIHDNLGENTLKTWFQHE